jgi:hypothetical protein
MFQPLREGGGWGGIEERGELGGGGGAWGGRSHLGRAFQFALLNLFCLELAAHCVPSVFIRAGPRFLMLINISLSPDLYISFCSFHDLLLDSTKLLWLDSTKLL